MLSALNPNESVYDITKFYKKLNRLNLLKKQKNIFNKVSLPKLSGSKLLEKNLAQSISISGKNSFKVHKIDLNYNKIQNNFSDITNSNIYENKQVLSENNIILPEVQKKKNFFSENNSPQKTQTNYCNYLYLQYKGENYNGNIMKNKIFIKIFPHKIIHSLKKIINTDEDMINNLEKSINKIMVDKYTTMSHLNSNLTSDFKTLEVDYNEILKNAEHKYILLTENNNNSSKHLFRIKNVFLENIIKNVITHTVEIRNNKNQVILKEDLENELNNQLELLKNFFYNALKYIKRNKVSDKYDKVDIKNTKFIKIKKHLIKTYNKIILQNFDENENNINSNINRSNQGYLTERNNRNTQIFNIFKKKLGMTKYQSIHNLYNNIISSNDTTQNMKELEDKKISTDNEPIKNNKNIKEKIKSNKNKLGLIKFYENYQELKDDLNINNIKKENSNHKYIFELGPNLKLVEFDEIYEEINNINSKTKNNITKSINNEAYFFKMLSDKNISNRINFEHIKNKNISKKIFKEKINKKNIPIKKILPKTRLNINLDILKELGNKLHKKIKVKIGTKKNKTKKNNKSFDSNKTEYPHKNKSKDDLNYSILTENKIINTETNSSMFSDIPSDFTMSYSEIQREKKEKTKKIREIAENKENLNESNIIDIDELFFNINKIKEKTNFFKKESIELDEEKDKDEEEIKGKDDDNENIKQEVIKDSKKNNIKKEVNMTNVLIKNMIKKRQIKYLHFNDKKEKTKSKNSINSNSTNKTLNNKEINKSLNKEQPKEIINNKEKPDDKKIPKNNEQIANKSDIKETQDTKDKNQTIIKKEVLPEKEDKNKTAAEKRRKTERKINTRRLKNERRTTNKRSRTRRNKTKNTELNNESNEKNSEEKNKEDINNYSYEQLMIFFNDRFNIPGKNNKIKIKKILYKSFSIQMNLTFSYRNTFSDYYYSTQKTKTHNINEIEKDKLIRNKSFSFTETKNDKKLILLKPILKHILHKRNKNTKQINDSVNKIFSVSYVSLSEIKTPKKTRNIKDIRIKKKMSFDYYGNNENKKNHRLLIEKYFSQNNKIEKIYYRDDNDLFLNYSKNFIGNKFFKKKKNKKKGFRDFLNDDDIYENNNKFWLDKFEKNKRENDIIRSIIEAKRQKKRKNIEDAENQFINLKSYIKELKNMTEEQFKYDTLRFIYKIKSEPEKYEITTKVKRINGFKNYIKTNEMNKLNNNKSILKNVLFQSNCVFYTDKIFKI